MAVKDVEYKGAATRKIVPAWLRVVPAGLRADLRFVVAQLAVQRGVHLARRPASGIERAVINLAPGSRLIAWFDFRRMI
jgi:hypothetical protein